MYKLQTIHKVWGFFLYHANSKCKVLKFLPLPFKHEKYFHLDFTFL